MLDTVGKHISIPKEKVEHTLHLDPFYYRETLLLVPCRTKDLMTSQAICKSWTSTKDFIAKETAQARLVHVFWVCFALAAR